MKKLLMVFCLCFPWPIRRLLLSSLFGFKIHPTARIGFAWILPDELIMEPNSKIGDLTVVKGLKLLHLKERASIGRANWITGYPVGGGSFFQHRADRSPALVLGKESAITSRHLLDCTDAITIGEFSIIGGFRSQMLTHSIDFKENRQSCRPISIGDRCFVGTNCVVLGGAALPNYSIMAAGSVLRDQQTEEYQIYSGVPAQPVKTLDASYRYFERSIGFVS